MSPLSAFEKPLLLVLLVIPPGLFCNSLRAYLQSIASVRVSVLHEMDSRVVEALRAQAPRLAIFDIDLADPRVVERVGQARELFPQLDWIFLTDRMHQQNLALSLGASQTILKCFVDPELKIAILNRKTW